MNEDRVKPDGFPKEVENAERRKLRARTGKKNNPLTGLAMFGLIGWSVTVPALLGVFAGLALDHRHTGGRSWTLSLLVAGLLLGCWNAAYWMRKENDKINKENK